MTGVAAYAGRRVYRRIVRWAFALGFLVAVFGGCAFGVYLWLPTPVEIGQAVMPGGDQLDGMQRTAGDFIDAAWRVVGGAP